MKAVTTSAPMAVKVSGKAASGSGVEANAIPTHADIAKRSYELFLERGGADGHDVEDWLRAEAELRSA